MQEAGRGRSWSSGGYGVVGGGVVGGRSSVFSVGGLQGAIHRRQNVFCQTQSQKLGRIVGSG